MNKLKAVILLICIAVCSTGCAGGQDVYVPEYYPYSWNANSGDTVIVIMNPDGDILQRCEDMGGELIFIPSTLIYQCEEVDF